MPNRRQFSIFLFLVASCLSLRAQQREPVLKQINHPHPYYFREMYLPQLTTGPRFGSMVAGFQSGCLLNGRVTVAAKCAIGLCHTTYRRTRLRLSTRLVARRPLDCLLLDMTEIWSHYGRSTRSRMQAKRLTTGHTVNVEPRLSPDGTRIAFVSTSYNGRFHIFTADFRSGTLENVQRMTGENRSTLPRYYYSPFDHEISPAWSPDGKELLFVSNRGHIYGTGGFWRMKAEPGGDSYDAAREIHYEETNWKARPEFSPDGKRIVYASYLGQSWHQLWTIPAQGGDAFPLSYGDFDNVNPRWSPDGKHIAFISNRGGNIFALDRRRSRRRSVAVDPQSPTLSQADRPSFHYGARPGRQAYCGAHFCHSGRWLGLCPG